MKYYLITDRSLSACHWIWIRDDNLPRLPWRYF